MKDWKKIARSFLILPIWLLLILAVLSSIFLTGIFVKDMSTHPVAYAVYVFSFYTLTVVCIACVRTLPGYYRTARRRVYANQYANRYLTDAAYKTQMTLYTSLGINLLYVATNAVSAVIYETHWFAIFAIYYGIMAMMRFLLVRYVGKNHIGESHLGELKRARVCAVILMTVNVTLSGVVLMMVYYDRGFEYQGYLIYVMALYTFYTTVTAGKDVVVYRKYRSPIMSVTKIIKLAASLFSMLFLETAMFAQFGQETPGEIKRVMIMMTGAGICAIVVGMSMYVIIRSSREIKEESGHYENGE